MPRIGRMPQLWQQVPGQGVFLIKTAIFASFARLQICDHSGQTRPRQSGHGGDPITEEARAAEAVPQAWRQEAWTKLPQTPQGMENSSPAEKQIGHSDALAAAGEAGAGAIGGSEEDTCLRASASSKSRVLSPRSANCGSTLLILSTLCNTNVICTQFSFDFKG